MNNNEKVEHQSNITEGKWIKYEKGSGSDYNILIKSIQGYHTDWVFYGNEEVGLRYEDVYIYYTLDKNGKAKVPRIKIEVKGDWYGNYKVTSIRGIADGQNMEPEMMPILNEKLKEFPKRDYWFKYGQNVNMLTIIDNKVNNNIELTIEELRFLYEIYSEIEGFGYKKDPRIKKIKNKRNPYKDYARIFNVNEDEVALSQKEWEHNLKHTKVLIGSVYIIPRYGYFIYDKNLFLPQIISGSLNLDRLYSAEGLVLPQIVGGSLGLGGLTSAKGLVLPKSIGGDLELYGLHSAEGLVLPQIVGGSLGLGGLTSDKGLVLPKSIGGDLILNKLTSAEGLILPQRIGRDLDLHSLTSVEGLVLPQRIGRDLDLHSLTSAEGLVFPQRIDRCLDLHSLTSAEGLVLPQRIGGDLYLNCLTSAKGLVLPYDFDINNLYCPEKVKEEIKRNPSKYFMKAPNEEKKSALKGEHQSNSTEGKWIMYERNGCSSNGNSLQDYYIYWHSVVGNIVDKNQLYCGKVYVYYTLDEKGEAKVPRIVIIKNLYNEIEEIRGIADNQNIEPEMLPILSKKLKEFSDREKYYKVEQDMNNLTLIDNKVNNNNKLTSKELRFLYEFDDEIESFGYKKDSRIEEIKNKRNIKKDYAQIYNININNVNEEEIALSQEEWKQNPKKIKVLLGDLYLNCLTSAEGLVLPQRIGGDLGLGSLTSAEGLVLPQIVGGYLNLYWLTSVKDLVLPQIVGGDLKLESLTSAEGLVLPQRIGGDLYLSSLTSAESLVLPQRIGGSLDLGDLRSTKGLVLPQRIGEDLYLDSLTSAEGLVLPQRIGGDLYLNCLTSAEGLILPYDFDIKKLYCPKEIKEEIMSNPDKYFMKAPNNEKEKRKVRIR